MTQARGGGGGDSRRDKYQKWPKGTKWAYFGETGPAGRKIGWVRVGSQRWKDMHSPSYNNSFGGNFSKPSKKTTAQWNPGSPQYRQHHTQGDPASTTAPPVHANHGKFKSDVELARTGNRAAALRAQNWLHTHGHPGVKVDGVWGPRSNKAAKAALHGKYNPVGDGQPGSTNPGANDPPKKDLKNKDDKQSRENLALFGKMIGDPNVGKMLPRSMADAIAGLQFDAPIHDMKNQIGREPYQRAQDLHDIANWYGQVQHLNNQAGDNATKIANQVASGIAGSGQDLMAALGGRANGAAGMMAAVTAQDAALQRQLGGIEATYRSDNNAQLENAQAGASAATSAQHSAQANDLQLKLADLLGQRGQARKAALMDILDKNNALAQQRFTNRQSKLESKIGALAAMGNIDLTRATTAAQEQQTHQGSNPSKHIPWDSFNGNDQYNMVKDWATGGDGKILPKNVVYAKARALKYTDPDVFRLIDTLYKH